MDLGTGEVAILRVTSSSHSVTLFTVARVDGVVWHVSLHPSSHYTFCAVLKANTVYVCPSLWVCRLCVMLPVAIEKDWYVRILIKETTHGSVGG